MEAKTLRDKKSARQAHGGLERGRLDGVDDTLRQPGDDPHV